MPAASPAETPTLRALLRRRELQLRLNGTEADLEAGALDRAVRWVHSSDLLDPTPFLSEGVVLLTTGTQFPGDDRAVFGDFVARLRARGVLGLGFGTEVVREGVPAGLALACREQRMPLFEVPYRTPFIAVARANAEAVAAQAYARRSWALAAQRAVSLAALHDEGLDATLDELSRRLDAWVGLFDSTGAATHVFPAPLGASDEAELSAQVGAVLRRSASAGSALRIGGRPFSLQTLGRGGHLRGVLAIGGTDLDQEARSVVTSVVAMAELSFAQNERLARAVARLRTALLGALASGEPALVRRISADLWGALPDEPIEVAVTDATGEAIVELLGARGGSSAFFARDDDGMLVLAVTAGDPLPDELATRFDARVGVSAPASYADFARARAQAVDALRRGGAGVSRFADVAASGVLAGIDSEAARLRAEAMLAPLRARGAALEETLRSWLEHDARFDATADALGVHRHTVRARIGQAARLLGVDLSGFPARAEVWAALQLARDR
ncbi:MAG: PucR family transcriptional regulator ligand-binding domain-containing protein [Microbacterium sp.]